MFPTSIHHPKGPLKPLKQGKDMVFLIILAIVHPWAGFMKHKCPRRGCAASAMAKLTLSHHDMPFDNIWNHHGLGGGSWAWASNIFAMFQHLCWEIDKSVPKEGLCCHCNGQGGLGSSIYAVTQYLEPSWAWGRLLGLGF